MTGRPRAGDGSSLRAAWWGLAALLFLTYADGFHVLWLIPLGTPWAAGALLLTGRRRAAEIAARLGRALEGRAVRLALVAHAVLLGAVAYLFGVAGALLMLLWAGTLLLILAWRGRESAFRGFLVNGAVAGVAVALSLGAVEAALHLPALAARLGTPAEEAAWEDRYDHLERRNVLGFRSPYERVRKPEGVYRVLALGDSFTWGDKIASADSAWPARLERELAPLAGQEVQVVNAGRRGFTTYNQAELLRRLGWQLDPDLVVLQFYRNDVLPSGPNFSYEPSTWLLGWQELLPHRFRTGPAGSSALYAMLWRAVNGLLRPNVVEAWTPQYRDGRKGWEQFRSALAEVGDSAAARSVPAVVMLFPRFYRGEWTTETYPARYLHERAAAAAREAGLPVLDLVPVFAARGGDWSRWWATPYDGHPGPAAHAVAADALARFLGRCCLPGTRPIRPRRG